MQTSPRDDDDAYERLGGRLDALHELRLHICSLRILPLHLAINAVNLNSSSIKYSIINSSLRQFLPVLRIAMLIRLLQGVWTKSTIGEWLFEPGPSYTGEVLCVRENETYESLVNLVRVRLLMNQTTPLILNYQLPQWMLVPDGNSSPPLNIRSNNDVEVMMSVRVYDPDPTLNVTVGPQKVAKYEFHCRSPFTVGETTFLADGITEAQHRQAIRDMVGDIPIRCARRVLELLFDEQQLLIVYRMALEIDAALAGDDDNEDTRRAPPNQIIPFEENIHPPSIQMPYQSLRNQHLGPNNAGTITHIILVFAAFELDPPIYDSPDHSSNIFRGASLDNERGTALPRLPTAWGETSDDEDFWDDLYEDKYIVKRRSTPHPRPTQGLRSLPKRVRAGDIPDRATVTAASDEDGTGSQTGSSDGPCVDTHRTASPPVLGFNSTPSGAQLGKGTYEKGGTSGVACEPKKKQAQSPTLGGGEHVDRCGRGPSLDLRLGLDIGNCNGSGGSYVEIDDSSSESDGNDGGSWFRGNLYSLLMAWHYKLELIFLSMQEFQDLTSYSYLDKVLIQSNTTSQINTTTQSNTITYIELDVLNPDYSGQGVTLQLLVQFICHNCCSFGFYGHLSSIDRSARF
ncbi:LOW QUALITY PROTEIN: hypothetical protein YC2023_123340 [Brassica napus]